MNSQVVSTLQSLKSSCRNNHGNSDKNACHERPEKKQPVRLWSNQYKLVQQNYSMRDQIGQSSYPSAFTCDGQRVVEFKDCLGFKLTDDYFRKAGEFHWPQELQNNQLSRPGISINKRIYKTVWRHHARDDLDTKPLLIYNEARDEFYRLTDYELLQDYMAIWKQNSKQLLVTPLDAYELIEADELPAKVRKLAYR